MSLIVKVHTRGGRTIVSVVDSALLGKVFEEGEKILDLKSDFYKGEEMLPEEIGDLIRNADNVTLIGDDAVQLGLKEGIIENAHVGKVKGIPYAQGLLLHD
jgi:hypothetical protein